MLSGATTLRRLFTSFTAVGTFIVLLGLLGGKVAMDSVLRYFIGSQLPPEPILANAFADPFLIVHAAAGVTALVIAPLQFVSLVRERVPVLHRMIGRIYVGACAVGAPSGFVLAIGTSSGPVAGAGFALLGILWPLFTYLAVKSAIAGRRADHRAWMIRSYAMAGSAITLRLMLPAAGMVGLPFLPAYQAISWLSWIANLALAELYLRRTERPAMVVAKVATA